MNKMAVSEEIRTQIEAKVGEASLESMPRITVVTTKGRLVKRSRQFTVRISKEQMTSLTEYSEVSGVAIDDLVEEAVADFIEAALSSRMEALAEKAAQS